MVGFYNYTVLLTYGSVLSAVIGMGLAASGRPLSAIYCLLVCGLCDMFDGTVARTRKRTEAEMNFGIQIDSLSDLVAFGILPAVIGLSLGLTKWYCIPVLALYVLCALIRLAYFNVTEDELIENHRHRICYEGLPVTSAALLFPFLFVFRPYAGAAFPYLYLGLLALVAAAFVIRFKVRKFGIVGLAVMALLGAAVLTALIVLQ